MAACAISKFEKSQKELRIFLTIIGSTAVSFVMFVATFYTLPNFIIFLASPRREMFSENKKFFAPILAALANAIRLGGIYRAAPRLTTGRPTPKCPEKFNTVGGKWRLAAFQIVAAGKPVYFDT